MQTRCSSTLALAALIGVSQAQAIGFGKAPTSVLLGSALDFAVPVRLEPGETLTAECSTVEVMHGEQRIAPGHLRVRVEPGASSDERVVRVLSVVPIEEPVITVEVNISCGGRMSRRFTAFVDPPDSAAAMAEAQLPAPVLAPVPAVAAVSPPADAAPGPAVAAAAAPSPELPAVRPLKPPVRKNTARTASTRRVASVAAPAVAAATRPRAPSRATAEPGRVVLPKPMRAQGGAARLRLEAAEPDLLLATAASDVLPPGPNLANLAHAAELTAATERVRALEQSIEQLRSESAANRELLQQMRNRMSEAENLARWAPWLGAALTAVAALALWLAWRLRRVQAQQQAQWLSSLALERDNADEARHNTAAAALIAYPASKAAPASLTDVPTLEPEAALPPYAPAARPITDTELPLTPEPLQAETPQREVAIDELIDLEQEADFFIALGQEEAAIDLLVSHLRSSGGTRPMPYLKLMEIYRRTGDRASYERTCDRFNHRFNAVAPPWEVDPQQGRTLEDYPAVLRQLSQAWPQAIDAMANIESMMYRRDDGELFDLPAYRELLFLYSLAHDIVDRQGGPAGGVDVLLPLGDSSLGAGPYDGACASAAPIVEVVLPSAAFEQPGARPAPAEVDLTSRTMAGREAPQRLPEGTLNLEFGDPPATPKRA